MLEGSVFTGKNPIYLNVARYVLVAIKDAKLKARYKKHAGESWEMENLLRHFMEEVQELTEALYLGDGTHILEEIADVSNMATGFLVPLICFLFIAWFGYSGYKVRTV